MNLSPAEQATHFGQHTLETPCDLAVVPIAPAAPLTYAPRLDKLSAAAIRVLSTDWPTRADRKILEAFLAGETRWRLVEGGCLYDGLALRQSAAEILTDHSEGCPSLP